MHYAKLAAELDETARQTGEMVEQISEGLAMILEHMAPAEAASDPAVRKIMMALQMQDRIAQRCAGLQNAARALCDPDRQHEIDWSSMSLDELRVPELSGVAGRARSSDEIELF